MPQALRVRPQQRGWPAQHLVYSIINTSKPQGKWCKHLAPNRNMDMCSRLRQRHGGFCTMFSNY